MNERGMARWLKITLIILLIIILVLSTVILTMILTKSETTNPKTNPTQDLTDEQALEQFDASFIEYLLYAINAQNLHKIPLSSDTPKINIYIDEISYGAEVIKSVIYVEEEPLTNPDIKITTTKTEAIEMIKDEAKISESFNTGASQIALVASKTKLFAKGYLSLYTDLTGEEADL